MRLDKYLKVSRIIKRRTVANEAVTADALCLTIKWQEASSRREGWRCYRDCLW